MFSARAAVLRSGRRAFSTTPTRAHDVAKLTLIGRLGKDPEVRTTANDKEYVTYTVATTNYPPPPPGADGTRPTAGTTWHRVLSFNPNQNNYLRTLQKGTRVYVEANYEIREPTEEHAQRQIFLRHETLRILDRPPRTEESEHSEEI